MVQKLKNYANRLQRVEPFIQKDRRVLLKIEDTKKGKDLEAETLEEVEVPDVEEAGLVRIPGNKISTLLQDVYKDECKLSLKLLHV